MNTTEQLFIRACKRFSNRERMYKRFESIIRRFYLQSVERDNEYFIMNILSQIVDEHLTTSTSEIIRDFEEMMTVNRFFQVSEKPTFVQMMVHYLENKIRFTNINDIEGYRIPTKFTRGLKNETV